MITVAGKDIRIEGRAVRIARLDGDKYDNVVNPEELIHALQGLNERADLFTFMQLMPDVTAKFDYPMEWDNLAVVPVSTYDNWWKKQIRSEARNRASQAGRKGIELREVAFDDALVAGIHEIFNESRIRQGRKFPHYGKSLEVVRKEVGTFLDRSIFIGAFSGSDLIGYVKLVTNETNTQAHLMNILSMMKHRDKAPTNALVAESVRACAQREIPYLVYQKFTYGTKKPDGITRFKEVNGFQEVRLPRYYIPLNSYGSMILKAGLHRDLRDRIPGPLRERLRELRDRWNQRRQG